MLNPKEPLYWDEQNLATELSRIFDICHGCRLCFNLCPSFVDLFKYIDERDGHVKNLQKAELDHVTDLCYQCKLCDIKCPYTPPHEWGVDIPRLLLREKAIRVKRDGIPLQDRFLGNPDLTGKMGCKSASLANLANRNPIARRVMEAVVGVHRDRKLPEFHSPTFEKWFKKRAKKVQSDKKVALFYTCFVNYNDPQQGIAAVEVLEKNGYEVLVPEQVCCGMPFIDGGDTARATANMEKNVSGFSDIIAANIPIVSPGPTCSYVLKNEFGYFTQDPTAQKMGKLTQDLCEFLVGLKNKKELNTDFVQTPPMKVTYQIPCHLRAQNMGYKSMELMRAIPKVQVELAEHCSAMDGTWGMKKQYYQISMKIAGKLFREVQNTAPDQVCTECPLSAIQIEQGTGKKAIHPVQLLHRAYGLGEGSS